MPYLPRNISDTFFAKIDGIHNTIQTIRSVAYLHFFLINRIETSPYLNEIGKAELYMAVPLFGVSEYNLITCVYGNSWKSFWISLAHNANKNIKGLNKHPNDKQISNMESLVWELSLNIQAFLMHAKLAAMRNVDQDANKIFSYLCDYIETNGGKELCRQIATEELTALAMFGVDPKKELSN